MTLNEYINSIKDKSIAVLGIGISNIPLIGLLLENGCDVSACDRRSMQDMGEEGERLLAMGAKLRLGEDYLKDLDFDIIFRTPGLMPFEPELEQAKARGSVISSEMEVFFAVCPCRTIAVTGSDGKTTTASIIAQLLSAAGHKVHLGGNIGKPLLCDVPDIEDGDIAVLELSSFQLHSMRCKPDVAVITNVSPNHLDKHKDYQDYIDAKSFIFINQEAKDRLILKLEDGCTAYYSAMAKAQISHFSDEHVVERGVFCKDGIISRLKNGQLSKIMRSDEIRLPGEHNLLNYLAAFEAVDMLVSDETCRELAMSFAGVEHRLEHVRNVRGVEYINDSIGSSPTRTIAGLRALKRKPIVIAGGYDKHIPFDRLGDELCRLAKRVFLTGDTAQGIKAAITSSQYYDGVLEVYIIEDFERNVLAAAESAVPGDTVLFSPACASFDKFKNFAERGNYFKKIVMELE